MKYGPHNSQITNPKSTTFVNTEVLLFTEGAICQAGGELVKADRIQCVQCVKKFSSRNGLNRHLKEIHKGVKDKQCEKCSYSTYSGSNLRLHISKVH